MKSFLAGIFLLSFISFSQEEATIPEILAQIEDKNLHDTLRVAAYFELANYYYYHDPDTTVIICQSALTLSIQSNYSRGISEGYGWLGYLHNIMGDTELALQYYHKSLDIDLKTNNMEGMAMNLIDIGYIYNNQGQIEKAVQYNLKCLEVREELGDKQGVASVLNNLGSIYKHQNDYETALDYFQQSLDIYTELDFKIGISTALGNIGSLYNSLNENDKANDYHLRALEIDSAINNISGMARSYNNLASQLMADGNVDLALSYYLKAYQYSLEVKSPEGMISTGVSLGRIYLAKGEMNKAKSHAQQAHKFALRYGSPTYILRSADLMSKIFVKENKAADAVEMLILSIEMRDSINNISTQQATQKLLAKQEYEKQKIIDDAEHEKRLAQEEAAKERQTFLNYALAGGAFVLFVFLAFIFNRLKITRKQKEIIEDQKHQVEEAHQEIQDSITYAKRIQSAILPPPRLIKENLREVFVLYKPKDIVAGDFYWMEAQDNRVLFAAADCTGHGVPGAMVSVICNGALNRSVREFELIDPAEILDKTRDLVIAEFEKSEEEVKDGMDIALCALEGHKLKFAGAHNPLWIIRKGATEVEELKADKQPIGKYAEPKPFTSHEVTLNSGDTFYTFSDGFADQFGGDKGKKFKAKNFKSLLISIQHESMDRQKELIDEAFEDWRGNLEQLDDVCVIGVRID